jgi:polysaccharide deacetylase family protein (PEP-CTERM system associated)
MDKDKYILLTVDVEDWFQVENFKRWVPFSSWDSFELRVEKNIHRLLDLFDSIELRGPKISMSPRNSIKPINQQPVTGSNHPVSHNAKATFFILGWISHRLPNLVREIHARGHEVASHGINHLIIPNQKYNRIKSELYDSKSFLEDTIGAPVFGFRAPSFSINNTILEIVENCGYLYDSSYNSFVLHGRYGKMNLSQYKKKGIAIQLSKAQNPKSKILYELPISNFQLGSFVIPLGGGAYFRLIPFGIFKRGLKKLLRKNNAFLFYIHPWEIDPDQPRVKNAFLTYKFRHYNNLKNTYSKLSNLIKKFQRCRFVTCSQYLNSVTPFRSLK